MALHTPVQVPLKVGGEVIFGDANLAAFRLDLLPDSLPAAPAGTKGECTTGQHAHLDSTC